MKETERVEARKQIADGWATVCRLYLDRVRAAIERGVCDADACAHLIDAAEQLDAASGWLPEKGGCSYGNA